MIDRQHMERHLDDVERLMRIAFVNGVPATREQIYEAWSTVSDSSAAGWLMLHDNDGWNWSSLSSHIEFSGEDSAEKESFDADIARIVSVCRMNGKDIDERQACTAWHIAGRTSWGANWLELPGYDEELWNEVRPAIQKMEEEEACRA